MFLYSHTLEFPVGFPFGVPWHPRTDTQAGSLQCPIPHTFGLLELRDQIARVSSTAKKRTYVFCPRSAYQIPARRRGAQGRGNTARMLHFRHFAAREKLPPFATFAPPQVADGRSLDQMGSWKHGGHAVVILIAKNSLPRCLSPSSPLRRAHTDELARSPQVVTV